MDAGQDKVRRQMGAVVVTGEDVDCSHCRCDPWRTNKLSERGKDKWMKERGVKGKKARGMLRRTKMRFIMRRF